MTNWPYRRDSRGYDQDKQFDVKTESVHISFCRDWLLSFSFFCSKNDMFLLLCKEMMRCPYW
jgi:hypothetical protein